MYSFVSYRTTSVSEVISGNLNFFLIPGYFIYFQLKQIMLINKFFSIVAFTLDAMFALV